MRGQRRLRLTIGLAAIGAVAGATAGAAIATIVLAAGGHASANFAAELYKLGTQTGATLGAALGPLAAFTVLRRVPIGRLFWHTAVGTSLGGIAGFIAGSLTSPGSHSLSLIMSMSVAGFGLAASHLWWRFRLQTKRFVREAV